MLRALETLETLERAGTPAAMEVMEALAGERAHPWVRAEAGATLARLRHRATGACAAGGQGSKVKPAAPGGPGR